MTDTNDTSARRPGSKQPLSLKKTETSTVKQSFSHGRTKAVVVEKKRTLAQPVAGKTPEKPRAPAAETPKPAAAAQAAPQPARVTSKLQRLIAFLPRNWPWPWAARM